MARAAKILVAIILGLAVMAAAKAGHEWVLAVYITGLFVWLGAVFWVDTKDFWKGLFR